MNIKFFRSGTRRFSFLILLVLITNCTNENSDTQNVNLDSNSLNTYLTESLVVNSNIPGAIALVDRPNQLFWTNAEGISAVESSTVMQIEQQFFAASITKSMTATITLQLMEEGLIDLDTSVSQWIDISMLDELTFLNGQGNGSQVTIRHLLNHTSGIYNYLDNGSVHLEAYQNNPSARYTHQERVQFAINNGVPYDVVGSGFYYSNTNYVLLGMIIEEITGTSLKEVFSNRIFTPLGMLNSHIAPDDSQSLNLVNGYFETLNTTEFLRNFNWNSAEGGLITTVEDLRKFARALFSGQLFENEDTLNEMTQGFNSGYGFGIRTYSSSGPYGLVLGHEGLDPGYFTYMVYSKDTDTIIIYTANRSEEEVEDSAYFINKVLESL